MNVDEYFARAVLTAHDAVAYDCPECGEAMDAKQTHDFGPVTTFVLTCPACGRQLAASAELIDTGDAEPSA